MNKFETTFFKKYIPEGHELIDVIHIHPIIILKKLSFFLGVFVAIPFFLYYKSVALQELISFYYFEFYLIIIYIKVIYDVFDWYNDVWLITSDGVVSLVWALFKTKSETLDYQNIEGISVEINSVFDKLLKKGDLVISKIGDDSFVLKDTINPYKAVNIVEANSDEKEESQNITETRFNQILESLNGVVGNYENEKSEDLEKLRQQEKKEYLKKAENSEGSIDLR